MDGWMDGWNGKKLVVGILEFGLDCSVLFLLDGEFVGVEGKLVIYESCLDVFVYLVVYFEVCVILI